MKKELNTAKRKGHFKLRVPSKGEKNKQKKSKIAWGNYISILIMLIGFLLIYAYIFDSKINLNGDNASYYLLGKSLHHGLGYNLYNDILEHPHNHFPPGYPLLIAIAMIFSKQVVFIKLINGIFLLASLWLCFIIFRKWTWSWQLSLTSVLFILVNYNISGFSFVMMSEVPFLFFSLLSFFLLLKIDFQNFNWKSKNYLLFLLCLSFAFHIRTIGIALLGGIIFYLLVNKKWKAATTSLIGFTILALPWILRGKILGLSSSYHAVLLKVSTYQPELGDAAWSDILTRIGNNFVRYSSKEILSGLLPFLEVNYKEASDAQAWIVGISLILLMIYALFKIPRYGSLIWAYLAGTFIILLLWPDYWFGTRFMVAILPFMIGLVLFSISSILIKLAQILKIPKPEYLVFLLLPILYYYLVPFQENKDKNWSSYPLKKLNINKNRDYFPNWKNYIAIGEYCKKNLKPTDIIACRKPQLFHIFSERYTTSYPNELDQKVFINKLIKQHVQYVVVEQLGYASTGRYLVPVINKNPKNFKVIQHLKNPDTYLLKFIPPK